VVIRGAQDAVARRWSILATNTPLSCTIMGVELSSTAWGRQ